MGYNCVTTPSLDIVIHTHSGLGCVNIPHESGLTIAYELCTLLRLEFKVRMEREGLETRTRS